MKQSQKGFSVVELFLILVIVGIIAVVGYRVWQVNTAPKVGDVTNKTETVAETPGTITKTADLTAAASTLDSTDVGDSDQTGLDSQLDF